MQKRDPVPEARQPLQQDPLARLRGLGADELRRGPLQLRMRDVPRRAERAEQIRPCGQQRQRPVERIQDVREAVHDIIPLPDHLRQEIRARRDAHHAAEHRSAPGVEEIDQEDRAVGVAHGLQNARLRTLLIDHARHCRDAHERRHGEEKQREHTRDAPHDIRIALKAGIADVAAAVQHEHVRVFELFERVLPVLILLLRIGQLLFAVRELHFGVGDVLLAIRELLLRVGKLGFRVGDLLFGLGLAAVVIGPAVRQLLLCVGQLLLAIGELLLCVGQLLIFFIERSLGLVELFLVFADLSVGLLQPVAEFLAACVELRLRRVDLLLRRVKLRSGSFDLLQPGLDLRELRLQLRFLVL